MSQGLTINFPCMSGWQAICATLCPSPMLFSPSQTRSTNGKTSIGEDRVPYSPSHGLLGLNDRCQGRLGSPLQSVQVVHLACSPPQAVPQLLPPLGDERRGQLTTPADCSTSNAAANCRGKDPMSIASNENRPRSGSFGHCRLGRRFHVDRRGRGRTLR